MNILVINGPNLNFLGIREKNLYGSEDYASLVDFIETVCRENEIGVKVFQSNHEGAIIDEIQAAYGKYDGIVINPAAYTHTSIAIMDALKAVNIPAVEVHLTDIYEREEFRRVSFVSEACVKSICGQGFFGYAEAVVTLMELLENR